MNEHPLDLDSKTPWGHVGAVMLTGGERFYMLVDGDGAVSLLPADIVEPAVATQQVSPVHHSAQSTERGQGTEGAS